MPTPQRKPSALSLTESLWAESRGTGVRVLSYAPGITRTEFFDVSGGADSGPSQTPEQLVDGALKVLARRNPVAVVPLSLLGTKNQ